MNKKEVYLDLSKLSQEKLQELGCLFIHSGELVMPDCLEHLLRGYKCKNVLHYCNVDKDWEFVLKNNIINKKEIQFEEIKQLLTPYPLFPSEKRYYAEMLCEEFKKEGN